jgi:thiosulfate/3-mercaptopyruvate sulfurtransferase
MLPAPDLRDRYRAMGVDNHEVIVYCGSGVTACHDLLAIRAAGLGDGRLFVGSWSAWGADHDRPVETGI